MHRFQSQSTITRIRFAAFFLWLAWIAAPAAIGLLVYSLLQHDEMLTHISLGLIGLAVVSSMLQWILALRPRCPLCMTPVLANKRCSKHRNSKTFLGSYRLRVATSVLFKGWFHCPYCNEPSALKVRERGGDVRMSGRTRTR